MAKPYYLIIFVLAIALAYSQSQTPASSPSVSQTSSGSAASGQTTPSNNAGSISGNATAANPQAPAPANPSTSQPLPGTTQGTPSSAGTQTSGQPGSATDASGGGVAGSAGTSSAPAQVPETPAVNTNPVVPDAELQSQIQNALTREPTLAGESVHVAVAEDNIEMNGNVATAKEKITATRIVQSYAGNKKIVSHLTVGAHAGANTSAPTQPPQN
jgi:hypothetical protein